MSRFIRTQAFVLRRTDFGEADRILSLITTLGQFSAMARGARKSKSKLAGGIEMLSLVDLVLLQGRGDIKTITSARLLEFFDAILSDYDRLTFAYLVLKQVEKASRDVEGGAWFEIIKEIFVSLNKPSADFSLIQAWFYLRLSSELGETLNLITDINGSPLKAELNYKYSWENRGLQISSSKKLTVEHIKMLRLLLSLPLSLVLKVKNTSELSEDLLAVALAHAAIN